MRWKAKIVLVAVAAACGCSNGGKDKLGLPLPTETPDPNGPAAPNLPEIDVGLRVQSVGGLPAANALVYGVHRSQGKLLGRTTQTGTIALTTSYRKFLTRLQFGEVEITEVIEPGPMEVQLVPVTKRPETVNIFGVGLESILHRGSFTYVTQGEMFLGFETTEKEDTMESRVLSINAATGVSRTIAEDTPDAPLSNASTVFALGHGVFGLYLRQGLREPMSWRLLIIHAATSRVLAERSGVSRFSHSFASGAAGELALIAPGDEVWPLLYVQVDSQQQVTIRNHDIEPPRGSARGAAMRGFGIAEGKAYFGEDEAGLYIVDLATGNRRVISVNPEFPRFTDRAWLDGTVVHWLTPDDGLFWYDNSEGVRRELGPALDPSFLLSVNGTGPFAAIRDFGRDPNRYFFVNTSSSVVVDLTDDLAEISLDPLLFELVPFIDGDVITLVGSRSSQFVYLEIQPDGTGLKFREVEGNVDAVDCYFAGIVPVDLSRLTDFVRCGSQDPREGHYFESQTGLQRSHFRPAVLMLRARDGSRLSGTVVDDRTPVATISFDPDAPR